MALAVLPMMTMPLTKYIKRFDMTFIYDGLRARHQRLATSLSIKYTARNRRTGRKPLMRALIDGNTYVLISESRFHCTLLLYFAFENSCIIAG